MEQHFQDVDQKVMQDHNLEPFSDQLDKYLTQKPRPQKCHEIMYFKTLYMVNPIGSMKTWG